MLFLISFVNLVFIITLISATCDQADKQSNYCFGNQIYTQVCNGSEWIGKVYADCTILDMTCRNANCVELDECEYNSDCEDNNACTSSFCLSTGKCASVKISGCDFDNSCLPIGMRMTNNNDNKKEFCNFDGSFLEQKKSREKCDNNFECESNLCLYEKCSKQGFFKRIFSWWF